MLIIIFLVSLCSNFVFIKSEDNASIPIEVRYGPNCTGLLPSYQFTEGQNVILAIDQINNNINFGWWRLNSSSGTKYLSEDLKQTKMAKVNSSLAGVWEFKFLNHKDNINIKNAGDTVSYAGSNYTRSICSTNITIVPAGFVDIKNSEKYIIIGLVVGVIALLIIVVQAAFIVYLKAKAKKLNRHNNLSKKAEQPPSDDRARYCSNPGQKMTKALPIDDIKPERESVIYEAPNIELFANRLPGQPPEPPAIDTMPRTPRLHNNRIRQHEMIAATSTSPLRSPFENHPTFPRLKPTEREFNSIRPQLALPQLPQENSFEVYEEMETEENTYEPPPIIKNTMPQRLHIPQKKVLPPPKLLDVQAEKPMPRINKPPVTPKPQRPITNAMTMTPANELEQAFRRRNNVVQVPVKIIPEPGTSKPIPKIKPPIPVQPKPKGPPVPPPVEEEVYFNERRESWDEEWTYEPLKPLNSYDANIYSV